ncbi:zinc finger MIZ domain-containing protein 1-like [Odontomachus brunneus]|uniref:zinc finger MIZ domain-containing protein 1-like n=1 Tax=Odontomachus brunneus TaxID=486640 RepID=UPI0013F18FA7|nr:zinc finger MIZ domain-containing protein 1-like [Odontomachus brunneus]
MKNQRIAPYPNVATHMWQNRQQVSSHPGQSLAVMQPGGFNNMTTSQYSNNYPSGAYPNFQPQYQQPTQRTPKAAIAEAMAALFGPNTTIRRSHMRETTPSYNAASQVAATVATNQYYSNADVPVSMGPTSTGTVGNQFVGHQEPNAGYGGGGDGGSATGTCGAASAGTVATSQYQQDVAVSMKSTSGGNVSYQHRPIPGNLTPPLTPAISSPNPNRNPSFNDMKSPVNIQSDEIRMTFHMKNVISFHLIYLNHNQIIYKKTFKLKPTVHQTLMRQSDIELQLKCFHYQDKQKSTNWPANILIWVNEKPFIIDRGENKTSHKPLYLKEVCRIGRNTIQITALTCCCSHRLALQMVRRPTVRSILEKLLLERLLATEHCINKIKYNFNSIIKQNFNSIISTNVIQSESNGVGQTVLKVSLKCPITFKRIIQPARGKYCMHVQCFDLESYLQLNCERDSWKCPVCSKPAQLEGLEVDQYIWGILNTLNSAEVDEVTIDSQAAWKAAKSSLAGIKSEEENEYKRTTAKTMSPGSMNMPTMNNWEMNQAMSPYIPPDMSSIVSGSMMSNMNHRNTSGGTYEINSATNTSGSNDYVGGTDPLSHLNESVNTLDTLNVIEKLINEQMSHTPHTPHTSQSTSHTPFGGNSGPPSVPSNNTTAYIPPNLNIDFLVDTFTDGEGTGREQLNFLPDNEDTIDYMSDFDLLDSNTLPSSDNFSSSEDILAFIE